jgi:hypothetical protein
MKTAQIEPFFATLQRANPQPVTELEYTSVFELLAAVLLSAQATDVGVNKATRRLFPVANTPQKMLDLGLEGLEGIHQDHRPVPQQGEASAADLPHPGGAARRPGAAHARGTGSPARRGPQDRQRGAERGVRRAELVPWTRTSSA